MMYNGMHAIYKGAGNVLQFNSIWATKCDRLYVSECDSYTGLKG